MPAVGSNLLLFGLLHGDFAVEALGHGALLCLWSPLPDSSLAGQEHGRTIPLGDIGGSKLLPCNLNRIPIPPVANPIPKTIDIGKNSFHVVGLDDRGAIVLRQKWSRGQIEVRLANMPPCLIGMEACVGAHHLSRKLQAFGHDARLMPGKYGNPLACAVARVALQVLIEEGMVENARAMGARFLAGLRQISSPAVKEVRGRGLMIAVELHPQAGGARRYCDALRLRGVLCKDTHDHTIRVSPPLVITRDEIDWALDQFDAALLHPEAA